MIYGGRIVGGVVCCPVSGDKNVVVLDHAQMAFSAAPSVGRLDRNQVRTDFFSTVSFEHKWACLKLA